MKNLEEDFKKITFKRNKIIEELNSLKDNETVERYCQLSDLNNDLKEKQKQLCSEINKEVVVDEQDVKTLLDKVVSLIFNKQTSLNEKEINIFKQIYYKNNPIELGSIIEVKENEKIKQYLIIRKNNNKEVFGVNCIIKHNSEVNLNNIQLNFDDSKTFLTTKLLYLKLKNSLSLEEVKEVLNLKAEYYRNQNSDDKQKTKTFNYKIGSVIRINNYDYIIVSEDEKNYYVTSYQNRNWVCGIETISKKYLECEYITKMDNTELLNLLVKISNQYNENICNNPIGARKKIKQMINLLEKIQNW